MSPEERRLAAVECSLLLGEIYALEHRAVRLISDLHGSHGWPVPPGFPAAGGLDEGPPGRPGVAP